MRQHVSLCRYHARNRLDVYNMLAGGVSMGERDFIKPLLERHGKVHFGKVKMKPGKPLTFATIELDSSRCHPVLSPAGQISYRTNPMKLVSLPGTQLVLCSRRCSAEHVLYVLSCIHCAYVCTLIVIASCLRPLLESAASTGRNIPAA